MKKCPEHVGLRYETKHLWCWDYQLALCMPAAFSYASAE